MAVLNPVGSVVLRDDGIDRFSVIDFQSFPTGNFELSRVEAKLFQNRGMDGSHVVTVFDGVESDLVGCPMHHPPLQAATGHPHANSKNRVIPRRSRSVKSPPTG